METIHFYLFQIQLYLHPASFSTGFVNLPGLFCCTEPFSLWGLYVDVTGKGIR